MIIFCIQCMFPVSLCDTPYCMCRVPPVSWTLTVRVRIVAMETILQRRNTVEDSSVQFKLCSGAELDPILLHAWNRELPTPLHLNKLDRFHMMWYKFEQIFNILCATIHFNLDTLDQKILVCVACILCKHIVIACFSAYLLTSSYSLYCSL